MTCISRSAVSVVVHPDRKCSDVVRIVSVPEEGARANEASTLLCSSCVAEGSACVRVLVSCCSSRGRLTFLLPMWRVFVHKLGSVCLFVLNRACVHIPLQGVFQTSRWRSSKSGNEWSLRSTDILHPGAGTLTMQYFTYSRHGAFTARVRSSVTVQFVLFIT